MTPKNQISIIGCGWLGLPLATHFIKMHYTIKGSTTSHQKLNTLKNHGVIPYKIDLSTSKIEGDICEFLKGSDTLIINIPPGLRKHPHKNHVAEINILLKAIDSSSIKQVLYVSSTSVFEDSISIPVFQLEDQPKPNTTNQLITIETLLKNNPKFKTTVVRFGGLFAEDRHPARFLSGKTNVKNPEAPINLIHRADCINMISKIITSNFWNKTLNLAYPFHPTKATYYTNFCKSKNIPIPKYDTTNPSKGKYIDSSKVGTILDVSFNFKP